MSRYATAIQRATTGPSNSVHLMRVSEAPHCGALTERIFGVGCVSRSVAFVGCKLGWRPSDLTRGLAASLRRRGDSAVIISPDRWRELTGAETILGINPAAVNGDASEGPARGDADDAYLLFEADYRAAADLCASAHRVGAAVLVARTNVSRLDDIDKARALIEAAGIPILGVVMTEYESRIPGWLRGLLGEETAI